MQDFTLLMDKGMRNLSSKGAFLTVKGNDGVNTMTISWGFVGFMWAKPHFITVVRPQRFTEQILRAADSFTVSIPFDGQLKEELAVCGTQSGRDIDKSSVVRFIPAKTVASPVVAGCGLYYECKIDLRQQFDGSCMLPEIARQFYKDDFHFMYFGEITDCYEI